MIETIQSTPINEINELAAVFAIVVATIVATVFTFAATLGALDILFDIHEMRGNGCRWSTIRARIAERFTRWLPDRVDEDATPTRPHYWVTSDGLSSEYRLRGSFRCTSESHVTGGHVN